MKSKKLLLCVLLFFALASFSFVRGQETKESKPPYYMTEEQLDLSLDVKADLQRPEEFLQIIYFHRVPGCDTCQLMSKYIYETIITKFKDDVADKKIVLRYMNFEDKKNVDIVTRLKIQSPSLAIIQVKEGKMVKAKLAGKIWSLAADKKRFIDYVQEEIDSYNYNKDKK